MAEGRRKFHLFGRRKEHTGDQEPETSGIVSTGTSGPEKLKKSDLKHLSTGDACRSLVDLTLNLDQKKTEYEQVTAYLTDIQLIGHMSDEKKKSVESAALKVISSLEDRQELQNDSDRLDDSTVRFLRFHEDEIPAGIQNMEDQEKLHNDIVGDLQKLDGEMKNLREEEKFYIRKLSNIKRIAASSVIIILLLSAIVAYLYTMYIFDIRLVLLSFLTVLAMVGAALFVKYRNVNLALAYDRKQQARVVKLTNKIKLKWVMNRSALDYVYSKYRVNSSRELQTIWKKYLDSQENEKRYHRTSKELSYYSGVLTKELSGLGLHDSEIWIYQAGALIDPREMVEITHSLNVRRKGLRDQMQEDEDMISYLRDMIKRDMEKEPEKSIEVQSILSPHHILL